MNVMQLGNGRKPLQSMTDPIPIRLISARVKRVPNE